MNELGLPVTPVENVTGFPEMLDGTLVIVLMKYTENVRIIE